MTNKEIFLTSEGYLELEQELNQLNIKIEEQEKQINQYKSNITQEQNKNRIADNKNEQLEIEIEVLKNEILELTRAKTLKIPTCPSIGDECEDKLITKNKYSSKNKESKDSDKINNLGITTNNTSSNTNNQEKKSDEEKENIKDMKDHELTPDNYELIKVIKLKNNFKWFLFKKLKTRTKKREKEKEKEQRTKTISRRFRCYSHKKDENILKESEETNQSNDSYSNYLWKPQKNRKDFIDFCLNNKESSEDKEKKIEYLEKNLKEMEEKYDKKEKDFNRLNLNYAKIINKSKNKDNNNNEELVQKLEKVRDENKQLRNTITKYKSEQQFIGLSFIADDLEGEQFIDDKCFEEILDGLNDEYKDKEKDKDKEIEKDKNIKEKTKEKSLKDRINNINFGNNNFYYESKINAEKTCINTINTNNTINNPLSRHIGARGFYKSKRKNG